MTLLVAFGCTATTFGDAAVESQRYKEICLSALHFFPISGNLLRKEEEHRGLVSRVQNLVAIGGCYYFGSFPYRISHLQSYLAFDF